MRTKHPIVHRTSLLIVSWLAMLGSAAIEVCAQTFPDPADGTYHFTSAQSGPWHDPATWGSQGAQIPATGDDILVQDGHVVTIQRQEAARHRFIRVEGELSLWTTGSTRLYVETLYVFGDGAGGASEGIFRIGDLNNPVSLGETAEVTFISSGAIDLDWDPNQKSRGLVSNGIIRLFGQPKPEMTPGLQSLPASSDNFFVQPFLGGWDIGDELVIAGTFFQRVANPTVTSSQDERVTITSTGDQYHFTPALAFDHLNVGGRQFHIVNLTRNVTLRSEDTTQVRDRGHVMLTNGDVHIENAAFVDLGRTDKRTPLDDKIITIIRNKDMNPIDYDITTPAPMAIQNRRGRYALHFHLNGIQPELSDPPSKVYGSVVDGTVGWGFVNHSSHVDFQRNIAYDFAGAGFVTELGDELGNFFDNIAIRGTGNGEYFKARVVFKNGNRPQPLSDFAFRGDGFWFQGPALRVKNNIASGCDGAGMTWFTTGAPDISQEYDDHGYTHNRYSHFPRSALDDVYGSGSGLLPRYWTHSATDEKLVISDLPILEFESFTAYGNLVGFKLRFNNHPNLAWYREDAFDYHDDIVAVCGGDNGCAIRNRQAIDQLTLWNNEQAFRMRYVTKADWSQVDAINHLAYDSLGPLDGHDGAELRFAIVDSTFDDLSIAGYPVAGWIQWNAADLVRSQITFSNPDPPAYTHYANFDTWFHNSDEACTVPTSVVVNGLSSTSANLTWQAGANNSRYLVRYLAQGDQHWEFLRTTSTSATLSGLSSATSYDVQIVAGCSPINGEHNLSHWTSKVSFNTN